MVEFLVEPLVLEGSRVRLEPLGREHLDGLVAAGTDASIFRWNTARMDSPEAIGEFLEFALREQARGTVLPFATREKAGGTVVGSTRFMAIDRPNLRVEIGWTWLAKAWQRTGLNREAKFLMMRHAFETWAVRRLEFKTHSENERSRTAIGKLGAVQEGILRKHIVMPDGSARDSVYFSVLDDEWPKVKTHLGSGLGFLS